jgi:hypothetical protein
LFLLKYVIHIYIKKKGEKKKRLGLEILIDVAKKKQKKNHFFFVLAEYMLKKTLIIGKLVSLDS